MIPGMFIRILIFLAFRVPNPGVKKASDLGSGPAKIVSSLSLSWRERSCCILVGWSEPLVAGHDS